MKRFFVTLVGSCLYTGFFPVAPATVASFAWVVAWLFLPGGHWLSHPVALGVMLPVAILLAGEMESWYGKDASRIVVDEFVGMQATFLLVEPSLAVGIAGFLFFRFFDIAKPFPVRRAEGAGGGLGVVLDDLLAGLYARAVLALLVPYLNSLP
ncbi:MAG: phosphatidylglycerophosphatase A [Candidatus Krumholzibacteriota bacterium]|nr:phosphatidylglycerophosphatase A [Candidatus Krumholzibacteriota bacterium]